jgi:hypothetical protein
MIGDEALMIDGDDVPASAEAATAEASAMEPIPRTTVTIRPQVSGNVKITPPPAFGHRRDIRKLWIAVITLVGLAILIAAVVFVLSEMSGS